MKNLLNYSTIIKHLERKGWKRKNIKNPETVASHSWHMAILALYLSKDYEKEYDFNKVINLCLCHDLAESIIGDITPNDDLYKNKKLDLWIKFLLTPPINIVFPLEFSVPKSLLSTNLKYLYLSA